MSDVNKNLLGRWVAFGKSMQKAGSKLPRHLIADTEHAIAAAEQAQQAGPKCTTCRGVGIVGHSDVCMDCIDTWQPSDFPAQQAEPGAWHTNDPCVSGEHIEAIAKVCKIIPSYTTVEYVDRIIGFGHVLLADKSVQEAFVRANSHLLRADPAKPPFVPDGCALVPIEPTEEMLTAMRERHWVIRGCQLCEEDYRDIFSSMLAAVAKT